MEEEGNTESIASSKSLLNWLNTFDVLEEKVTQLEELASGQLLFKCLKSVISEATGMRDDCAPSTSDTEVWSEVWRTLEEFCGCSLDKSVSRQEVLLGNQEHIARVVVLFLCTVSYSKNNEQVVERIKSLENSDQREIMFFIQNTIASINTNAVADGSMTSGIGDILPVLEEQASPSSLSQPSTPTETPASLCATYHLSKLSSMTPLPIPKVTSSGSGSAFDSPIGMKWFTSPAISKNNPLARVQAASPFTAASSRPTPLKLTSEVSRLQRRIHLLQGMVDTNKKTAADYYSDLCAKSEHCETLLAEKNQLLAKIDQLEKFRDLQDELDQAKLNLSKAEKSVERLYAEKESLLCYKDQAKKLEDKVKDYDLALSKLQKYKEKMDSMSVALSEKTSTLDQLDIAHRTVQGQLERKTSEHDNLSLQNDEYSREIRELLQKCQALEEDKQYLQSTLEKKTESEQLTMAQSRELDASLERAKGELETVQGERDSLEEQLKTVQADFASFKAAVDHTLQDVQKENDSLKVKCSKKDRELENEVVAKQSLSSRVAQLEDKCKQLSSLTLGKANLEKEVTRIRSDLAHSIKRCEVNESALSACKAELAEKDELIMALSSEKIELLGQRDNLQANMEGMNTKYNCLAQDMDGLRKESASITRELDNLISKDGVTQKQYSQLQASNKALAGQLARAQQELKEERASGVVKDGTIASLSANKVELEQQILQLRADYGGLLKAKEATEVELNSQSSSKEEKTAALIEEKTSLAEQLRELQTHRDDMEAKVLILEDTLAEKEKELNLLASSVKTGLEEQIKLQNQLHTRQAEMEQLKKQFSAKDVKTTALQAENASLSENWRQLKTQKEEAERRLADKEKELKALASSMRPDVHVEQQITKLQDELHTKQAEIEQHKSQCATNDEKTRALETENASLSQQLKELLAHKKDTESRLSDLEERLADKEKEVDALAASVKTNLEEQISELQNKLQAKQVDMEQCNSYLDSYKSQLSSMEERITSLESEKRALKERNAELESGYQAKSETDDAKVRKCHEVVAEFQTTVDQMKEMLENRNKENARLKESLIQSEETASAIREKSEAALKKLEEEKASMSEAMAQLEERLQKALEQQKESMDQCEQISNQLELNQQKYSSELQILSEQNRTLQTWQDEKYNQIRDENTENFRKMTKLYEEMDHLRAREQETTALCREYKMVAEREQGRALSTTEEVKKLQGKLESYEVEKVKEVELLEQELEQIKYQLLKEQRQAASEKSSLTAQLNYASEKIRLLEKSSQVSSPRPRPGSRSSRQKLAPNPKMDTSASTISNFSAIVHDTHSDIELESQIQHEFDHLTSEGTRSVIPTESPSTEEDDELTFSGATSKKRATLASQTYRGRSGTSSRLSTLVEDRQEDDEARISELQRRNSKALPHLKSSYAVELQTHRDSPSICNERIKNGSRRFQKTNKPPQTVSSLHLPAKKPVAFEIGLQPDPLLSSTMVTKERKRSRERDDVAQNDDNTMRSPAPKSLRRGSAPPTPQTPVDILSSIRETRRSTMAAGGLKLREYLDKPADGDSAGQSNSGTTFMVSPPNSKAVGQGKLPKRLQENLNRRQAAQKQQSSSSSSSNVGVRRATIVKGRPKVSASAASRRNALKTKN